MFGWWCDRSCGQCLPRYGVVCGQGCVYDWVLPEGQVGWEREGDWECVVFAAGAGADGSERDDGISDDYGLERGPLRLYRLKGLRRGGGSGGRRWLYDI